MEERAVKAYGYCHSKMSKIISKIRKIEVHGHNTELSVRNAYFIVYGHFLHQIIDLLRREGYA